MPIYQYRAINFSGQKVSGEMEASNAIDLETRLASLDLMLLRCDEKKRQQRRLFGGGAQKMTRRDLINFTFQLERLVVAGVAILEGLRDVRDSAESPSQQYAAGLLVESIQAGATLSTAMATQPETFDTVYVSLIRTGELSGKLDQVLHELVESLKWQDELSEQVKRLTFYPSIILIVVLAATTFSLVYLVPKMKIFIVGLNQSLPWYTVVLLGISDFLVDNWLLTLTLPLAGVIGLIVAVKTMPPVALIYDEWILKLPSLGPLLRKIALARFASMFALMYGAGISVLESLHYSEATVGNRYLGQAINRVRLLVSQGSSLADGFARTGLFPLLVIRMIKVGETTGGIDDSLRTVAYFYQRDIRDFVEKLLKAIEPVLTVFLGGLLAYIMISVILPIYDAISKAKLY